jgi:hypothetical protein
MSGPISSVDNQYDPRLNKGATPEVAEPDKAVAETNDQEQNGEHSADAAVLCDPTQLEQTS